MQGIQDHTPNLKTFFGFMMRFLAPERDFYSLVIIYGIGISVLSLALPISVQLLINTVANVGLTAPLVILSATLFGLLLASGLLNALRIHLMEIFGRRFYARMVADITLRSVYARNPFFQDSSSSALFNRYFDIIIIQKTVPILLIGGFTVMLQTAVGFVLVSLYHPLFLVFNVVVIGLIWAIWLFWGGSAIRNAMVLSQRKHETAAWLERLGASNGFFKTRRRIDYALAKSDEMTFGYIDQHRRLFRRHFAQTVSFLVLYAAASAALLGLGGWLVIQGQLSLGQLVAAELVLAVAFFGLSQFGMYLGYFYDICAAIEELALFQSVEQEKPVALDEDWHVSEPSLAFFGVKGRGREGEAVLKFELPGGALIQVAATNYGMQRLFTNLLRRHEDPKGGYILLGGADLIERPVHELRREIFSLDRSAIIEMTIREYLKISGENVSPEEIMSAINLVGLGGVIAQLDDGLDTPLASTGWPLSTPEVMQLKLAGAVIARPKIVMLGQLFDLVDPDAFSAALGELRRDPMTTVIYFSDRRTDFGCDGYLFLGEQEQVVFDTYEALAKKAYEHDEKVAKLPVLIKSDAGARRSEA
ncbi:MAG: ABC transporter ATP-binding protein [Pseudomonadota bacterium]